MSEAAESASAVNALALRSGARVVFGEDSTQQKGETGRRLLAHELTHVVQQSGNEGSIPKVSDRPGV